MSYGLPPHYSPDTPWSWWACSFRQRSWRHWNAVSLWFVFVPNWIPVGSIYSYSYSYSYSSQGLGKNKASHRCPTTVPVNIKVLRVADHCREHAEEDPRQRVYGGHSGELHGVSEFIFFLEKRWRRSEHTRNAFIESALKHILCYSCDPLFYQCEGGQ